MVASLSLLFLAGTCCAQVKTGSDCLSYEPAAVKLTGILIRKTFPGPPNYESIRKGDKPETYWLLRLAKDICVNEDKLNPAINIEQKNIRTIELVLSPEIYQAHRA